MVSYVKVDDVKDALSELESILKFPLKGIQINITCIIKCLQKNLKKYLEL